MSLRYTRPEQCLAYEKKLNDPRTPIGAVTVCPKWTCARSPEGNPENRQYECICGSGTGSEDDDERSYGNCLECLENCSADGEPDGEPVAGILNVDKMWDKLTKKRLITTAITTSVLIVVVIVLISIIKRKRV